MIVTYRAKRKRKVFFLPKVELQAGKGIFIKSGHCVKICVLSDNF